MPNSRFSPFLIHGLCALFASNSRWAFFRLVLTPLATAPSPPPSQFTVCTSRFTRSRILQRRGKRRGKPRGTSRKMSRNSLAQKEAKLCFRSKPRSSLPNLVFGDKPSISAISGPTAPPQTLPARQRQFSNHLHNFEGQHE